MTAGSSFDVVVVGGGLIGSAAARHLAEAGHSVVLIAAPEPSDWRAGQGPFASHYDAGRITRITDFDPIWSEIARRSIDRYQDVEQRSGITFHHPVGLAWIAQNIDEAVAVAIERGADCARVDETWLYETTGIRAPSGDQVGCAWEAAPAGAVNPRRLAAAQAKLVEIAGGVVIHQPAVTITPGFSISTEGGTIDADRILLATGAYGAELVGVELALERMLRTTVRIDLGPGEQIPSLICRPIGHPELLDVYWNPPLPYPDGRRLFKIGSEAVAAAQATSKEEINAWFTTDGDASEAAALIATTRALLPDAEIRSTESVPCVVTRTAHSKPYVGWVDDGVAVALGGNGASAKSSDEIGRLASTLFQEDGWDDSIPAGEFTPRVA